MGAAPVVSRLRPLAGIGAAVEALLDLRVPMAGLRAAGAQLRLAARTPVPDALRLAVLALGLAVPGALALRRALRMALGLALRMAWGWP